MFNVMDKNTGEVFTVYGLNGTHFLIYNAELDWWFYKNMDECKPYDPPKEAIRNAPTVNAVEAVHGQMEEIEPCMIRVDRQCCSCGTAMGREDNYCPNCGAKMDGERK